MSAAPPLPREVAPFVGFCRILRGAGFLVAPPQSEALIAAVSLLGPRSMEDIRQAALATLAPPVERHGEFDVLFRAHFFGETPAVVAGEDEEEGRIKDDGGEREEQVERMFDKESGARAAATERLAVRAFGGSDDIRLASLERALATSLPVRRSFRSIRASNRGKVDLRRSIAQIVHADGDVPRPVLKRRKTRQRKILMLIDISGSMKLHTADYLKVAHALVQGAERAEVLTLGTRLTRITSSLRLRSREQALARVADQVEDWDGGTRLGATLMTLLVVPRFAAFTNGAVLLLLSDALERGDHTELALAVRRISARADRLSLATPLAGDPRFRPETAALKAILPMLDDVVDGSSIKSLTDFILTLGVPTEATGTIWRKAA